MSFTNIGVVEAFVMAHLAKHRDVGHVVLIGRLSITSTVSAREARERLCLSLREAGATAHVAEVKGPVSDAFGRVGSRSGWRLDGFLSHERRGRSVRIA